MDGKRPIGRLEVKYLNFFSEIQGPEWAQMFVVYLGHLFVVTWHGIVRTLGMSKITVEINSTISL